MDKFLCVLGSGIKTIAHITLETVEFVKNSDIVLFLVNEPLLKDYIKDLSKNSFDLEETYYSNDNRKEAYQLISEKIVEQLELYDKVSVILYGHPIYCSSPAQKAIRVAKDKGINIISCPAVSSLDCLFSDLNIDPAEYGMQIYTADQFINENIKPTTSSYLVLLQSGFINFDKHVHLSNTVHFNALLKSLKSIYHQENEIIIYESSIYPNITPLVTKKTLQTLEPDDISSLSTIIIKALGV
jgi:uncharacterized protein YabN with tetrapyrrole methylase and pyrophosphatase domain